jgi:hypothetical protein
MITRRDSIKALAAIVAVPVPSVRQTVRAKLVPSGRLLSHWEFAPGSDVLFAAMADEIWPGWRVKVPEFQASPNCPRWLKGDCWPQWVKRARTEQMRYAYHVSHPDGDMTEDRLRGIADRAGVRLIVE